jgi:hypothetical protein
VRDDDEDAAGVIKIVNPFRSSIRFADNAHYVN